MTENYDESTKKLMNYAIEDLQKYMATAGASTTEAELMAWQQGYIAGVQRGAGETL